MGLIQGMEIVKEKKEPARISSLRSLKVQRSRDSSSEGGLYGNVIRITPPLTVERGRLIKPFRHGSSLGKIEAPTPFEIHPLGD